MAFQECQVVKLSVAYRGSDCSHGALQGPSPDEVALVEGGRQLGFEFVSRNMSGVVLRIAGHQAEFEVLNMMEFTSERGRMTVIARCPDGTIRLFCKGSDAKMLKIVRKDISPALLAETDKNLHLFATQVSWGSQMSPSHS